MTKKKSKSKKMQNPADIREKIESRLVELMKGSTLEDLFAESRVPLAMCDIKDDELTIEKLDELRNSRLYNGSKAYDEIIRMVGTNYKDLSPQERTEWGIYISDPSETFRAAKDFPGLRPNQRYRIADSMPPDSFYRYSAALEIRGLTSGHRYMLLKHCTHQESVLKGARDVTDLTMDQRFKLASRLTEGEAQHRAIDEILGLTNLQKYSLAKKITCECALHDVIMNSLGFTHKQRFELAMKLTNGHASYSIVTKARGFTRKQRFELAMNLIDMDIGVDTHLIDGVARFTPGLYPTQRVELIQKAISKKKFYSTESYLWAYKAACYTPGLSNEDRMKIFLTLPDQYKVNAAKECITLEPKDRKALLDSLSECIPGYRRERVIAEVPSLPADLYSQDS